jgi:arsenate reductase
MTLTNADETIEPARREALVDLARALAAASRGGALAIVFLCTHNSRRSQLAQVLAQTAARRAGLTGIATYSAGTAVSAVHPATIKALRRAGYSIARDATRETDQETEGAPAGHEENPIYLVSDAQGTKPERCFSKLLGHLDNPASDYFAVVTCSAADHECPSPDGALGRASILYDDPGTFDGQPTEQAAYDAAAEVIGREMRFLFERLAALSG